MALITLQNYLDYGSIGYTGDNAILTTLIDRASRIIEDFCDRGITSQARTEVYEATHQPYLYLDSKPVSSISSVQYAAGVSGGDQAWTTLGTGSYWCDTAKGILWRDTVGESYWGDVGLFDGSHWRVTYTAGEANPAIEQVCCELVDMLYANRRRNQSLANESIGGAAWTSLSIAEQRDWLKLKLGKYRKVSL